MNSPQIGQRWIVDTDSSLGLGMISACDARTLTVDFTATGESRCYSRDNAPLKRVAFSVGDTIDVEEGRSYVVAQVEDINGLLIYLTDDGEAVPETRLSSALALNHPVKRLLAGQLDKPQWFDLRADIVRAYHQWLSSGVFGLQGARITLTPHQLYVANTATALAATRILLADEVGLGKTIEAGLILQRMLLQDKVARVLIVVPEALQVQWFVELVRCFNIHAVLYCEDTNLDEARVFIVPHALLQDEQIETETSWDMMIVDEAHHFDLVNANPCGDRLKIVGRQTRHVLLLSATPERMGLEQHFARLTLLDASRFHDFDAFQRQYQSYENMAEELAKLVENPQAIISHDLLQTLTQALADIPEDSLLQWQGKSAHKLVDFLLDCHGTGRIVFRNTRSAVQGFPKRCLTVHSLDDDQQSRDQWLAAFVKQHSREKILLIAHYKDDVLALRESLYRTTGIDCPVFHEDMSLIERDRAAAYFADQEEGAPLLLCSEIGSEGRNFQFCHHLICWDLPEHPDFLEQRIGRLDRIGQKNTINIHVCISNEESRQRLNWYHHILEAVEQANPAAGIMHQQYYQQYCETPEEVAKVVRQENKTLLEQLHNGRDRLLEINSCRQPQASILLQQVQDFEALHSAKNVLTQATELLNLHFESLDASRYSLIPSYQMLVPMVPGIAQEGSELTFDRDTAIAREDVQFVTWDHPLMQGLTEMIVQSDLGVATVALFPNKKLKPGTLCYEAIFNVVITDACAQTASTFLSESLVRIVVIKNSQNNLHDTLPQSYLKQVIQHASKKICKAVVKDYQQDIQMLAEQAKALADNQLHAVLDQSLNNAQEYYQQEQSRLLQLQQYNSMIVQSDIDAQKQQADVVISALQNHCRLEINAVRLLVSCQP